ncbi:hypothetical protein L228DRAFT_282582 [Xylona heveae TC161]|uniref:Amine oxidase n=1 Tax=Xylona heveae (strain CBS 132557 / TC161) TaxID=1328760 RepID=A0A165HTB4_XYLHT|nr:hypothetical protein L228DRAFT_282582 [Xylona heveae TC161]KZF23909.1 hypothetical protein L228DRAFT_282582 [Xylona heveae TC161]
MAPPVNAIASAPLGTAPMGLIHVSGQPRSPVSNEVPADFDSQVLLSLLDLHRALLAAGGSIVGIARLTLYIVNYNRRELQHTRHLHRFLRGHNPIINLVPVTQLAEPGWQFLLDAEVAISHSIPQPLPTVDQKAWDVIVLGAGLSGLTAADQLIQAGLSCLVLEARDRVGGRTWSASLSHGKGIVDIGASWLNNTNQSKVSKLARRFEVEFITQNTSGNCLAQDKAGSSHVFAYGGLPVSYRSSAFLSSDPLELTTAQFDTETQKHLGEIRDLVEADCQQLDSANPQNPIHDAMTFLAYLCSRNASETAIASASIWSRAMLGQEPQDISALYFLHHCKAGGGLLQMRSDRVGGGQYLRIRQGTQSICKGLAASLPSKNILLSSPVTAVNQSYPNRVYVQTGNRIFQASKVISTVPSPVLRGIQFTPTLPARKQLLVDSYTYGYFTKAMLVFKNPFWAEKGFCGLAQSFTGPASIIRDCSSPEDDAWILTCFLCGDTGRTWSQQDDKIRTDSLLEQIGLMYSDKTRVLSEYLTTVWHDWTAEQYSGFGCPCPSLPPGVLSAAGDALREPFWNVHFSGTETSVEWKGFMEGAVRSGERSATEVSKQLVGSRV